MNGVRSLTASAARVNLNDRNSIKRFVSTRQGWQEEAWAYRREVGEARYATAYLGNSAMRMRLFPAAYLPGGATPSDATHAPGLPPDLVQAAADTIARLASGGPFALGMMLKKQTENFEVAGECYLIGQVDAYGVENWNVYSVSEVTFDMGGRVGIRMIPGNGMSSEEVQWLTPGNSYVTRLWWPDPQFGAMADSPFRAALGILYELQLLSMDVRATAKSRLANNGMLLIPEGLSIIGVNPADETTIEGDPFMRTLVEAATSALQDEGSAAAVLPLLIRGQADALKELRHMPLDRAADAENANKRKELLGRFATTIDLPSEILTGIADLNHWSAWQVDDNAFRHHIEPVVQVQIDALTAGFLWPMLNAYKRWSPALIRQVCIWYDPTELVTHPDRAVDAKDAFDRGAIGRAALREYLGMGALDKPDDLDEVLYVLSKAARVDPVLLTSVLKSLKQTSITIPDAPVPVAPPAPSAIGAPDPATEPAPPGAPPQTGAPGTPAIAPPASQTPATAGAATAPPADMTKRIGIARGNVNLKRAITAAADPQAPVHEATPTPPGQQPEHSGAMVALYPTADTADQVALPDADAEPANDLHVTMLYLPDFDQDQLPALQDAVDQFAQSQPSLSGKIGGKGQFNPSEGSDGNPVTYGSVDVPGLTDMQSALKSHLQSQGFNPAENHGFTPHMTLAYGEKPDLQMPDTPLDFKHLSVVHGDDRKHYPLAQPAPVTASATPEELRDSAKLAQLDRDLRARLHTAANSTMRRAFEKAGAKVVTRSRTPIGRQLGLAASIEGLATWEIPQQLGTSLLASLGINDLINDDTLSELHEAYDKFVQTASNQALRLAAKLAGLDVNTAFGMREQLLGDAENGWHFLVQSMTLRAHELLAKIGPGEHPELETTDLVPYGTVRATIAIAGGQDPNAFDTSGQPARPGVVPGGFGNGSSIASIIEGAGGSVQQYKWHHGWATNPFEPHLNLDGTTFSDFTDERFRAEPLPSGADFPPGGFYIPGDHKGCTCDLEVIWQSPAQPVSQVAAGWNPDLHPRDRGKFAKKGGGTVSSAEISSEFDRQKSTVREPTKVHSATAAKLGVKVADVKSVVGNKNPSMRELQEARIRAATGQKPSDTLGTTDTLPGASGDDSNATRPDGSAWGSGYPEPSDPRNDPVYDQRVAALQIKIDGVLSTTGDTEHVYDKRRGRPDNYSKARQAVHQQIFNEYMAKYAKIPKQHKVIMLAGPPGSGKTTVLKNNGADFGVEGVHTNTPDKRPMSSNFAILNADDVKADLQAAAPAPPQYARQGLAPNEQAQTLHEESSYLMKRIQTALAAQGTNLIIDGTFGGNPDKQRGKVDKMKAEGYQVSGVLVDGSIGTALAGAGNRHQKDGTFKGRYVPYSLITEQEPRPGGPKKSRLTKHAYRSANAQNFDSAVSLFDGVHVYDRNGGDTVRTAFIPPNSNG